MSFEGQITDKIYHGSATRYANGERKLINFEKCERCLLPNAVALLETARHRRLLGAEKELNKKENIDCWTV